MVMTDHRHSYLFTRTDDGIDVQESANEFESSYRHVTVSADTGDNSSLEITEQYDPSVEDVQTVVARCADNLRVLLRRNGK